MNARPAAALLISMVAAGSGCAAAGVTLRSNHYQLQVPPDWQVVATGGTTNVPTVLRIPAQGTGAAQPLEIRLYPWLVQGAPADPTGDALKQLIADGVLDLGTKADDDEPCPDRSGDFRMFGKSARAIHIKTSSGQRVVITAGHEHGSLVSVVGIMTAGQSPCADVEAVNSTITRLISALTGPRDATRPQPYPTTIGGPGLSMPFAPIDPAAPP